MRGTLNGIGDAEEFRRKPETRMNGSEFRTLRGPDSLCKIIQPRRDPEESESLIMFIRLCCSAIVLSLLWLPSLATKPLF